MASGSGGGFSKEQLALAKQLQSGYVNSGTFHSQGQSGSKGGSPLPASRMPHATQPVRSMPPHLRAANGLVRPLPSNAPATPPAAMNTAGRPAPPVQPSGARPTPPAVRPTPASSAPAASTASAAPATSAVPPHARASLPVARSITQSSSTAGSAPPVQPMPANNLSYTRPPPMPTNLQPAMTPTPMYPTALAPASKPAVTTIPTTASNTVSNTVSNATSAALPTQQSQNAQLIKSAFDSVSFASQTQTEVQNQAQAQAQTQNRSHENNHNSAQVGRRDDAVSKAVMQGIKINQAGKPIVWNWASEEPIARELTADEIEQMKKNEPLPPMIYDRPFHANATMKAPGLEGKSKAVIESPPRKAIGLKGSRHAY